MSIIIRLQNLPISAKTGDIRKFFGGLRIPDGGVHILGGEKGDAFIAFMSDEDARLAMRKDGGRIKDSRLKLFLSSRMEMQHEVEKITKGNFDAGFYGDVPPSTERTRSRSREKRRRSRSPHHDDRSFEKSRPATDHRRSKSPVKYSTKKLSPPRYRSRSPRKRSRSPKLSVKSKPFTSKRKSPSPKNRDFHSLSTSNDFTHFSQKSSESQFLSQSERQAELERRITEEIEKNALYKKALREEENNRFLEEQQRHLSFTRGPEDLMLYSDNSNMQYLKDTEFKHDYAAKKERLPFDGYYILLEGMEPNWNFREVQILLKGHYAPQNYIKMEMDDAGFKTGRAIVKLSNKDDFDSIFKKSPFHFRGKRIDVMSCPHYIAQHYFPSHPGFGSDNYFPMSRNLCYILKGLPFTCKYEDVVAFFSGFEISDVIIFYGEDGQAKGTGFVSFKDFRNFQEAFSRNGKKIGHRYIEMLPCTAKEMAEAKKMQPGNNFTPYSQIMSEKKLSTFRRPICAILTGLPFNISIKKILNFFSESGLKPDAIHLTLSKRKQTDGRAFVEFSNYLDFDLALKFHGKLLDKNVVCIKQILYDDMVKILDSQKAKHYFASSDPAALTSAEPEKVPYLWEPPDERHEKEAYVKDNRASLPSDKSESFPYENVGSSFQPDDFPRRPHWNSQTNAKMDSLYPMYPSNDDIMHNPIPYDEEFMGPYGDDYHSNRRYEENIKSSRLSPENEAALLDFLNKDRKPFSSKSSRRSRSLERRNKNYPMPRSKDSSRIERGAKYYERPASPNQLHPSVDEDLETGGCIVQLSNVDASVGTRDLLTFLRGFDFAEDTLIRRYTSDNVPTPDVRVTFSDKSEAERAIRILNKRFLHGKPVDMFIV